MITPALRRLSLDARLGPRAIRVYAYLTDQLDFGEYRAVKLYPIARALGIRRDNVASALRMLVTTGYLDRNGRAWPGGPFTYRMIFSPRDEGPPVSTPKVA